jgi:excisionase family DNA binding protein
MCATAATEVTPLPLWLSVPAFAQAVGISDTLAGQLADTGLIRAHRHGTRRVIRIHRDEVARYLAATLIHPDGEVA